MFEFFENLQDNKLILLTFIIPFFGFVTIYIVLPPMYVLIFYVEFFSYFGIFTFYFLPGFA